MRKGSKADFRQSQILSASSTWALRIAIIRVRAHSLLSIPCYQFLDIKGRARAEASPPST